MAKVSKSVCFISFSDGDLLEQSDQGHLLKNRVSVRDSAIVTIKRIGNDMSQIKWHNQFDLW